LKRFEETRNFMQYSANKYDNKGPIISLIFGFGFLVFAAVLYFVGVFDMLQEMLGGLFFPVMAGALILAALFIFVIVPRQYQASVEMARSMGTPLAASPLGEIQTIEARAERTHLRAASIGADINPRRSLIFCKWTVSNSTSQIHCERPFSPSGCTASMP
jgi:hypothetical protein